MGLSPAWAIGKIRMKSKENMGEVRSKTFRAVENNDYFHQLLKWKIGSENERGEQIVYLGSLYSTCEETNNVGSAEFRNLRLLPPILIDSQ